jgi:hypothetical protein
MIIGFVKVYRHRGFCYLNPMANSLSFLFSIVYGTLGGRVNPALAIPFLALSTFDPSYTVSSPGGYDVPWPSQNYYHPGKPGYIVPPYGQFFSGDVVWTEPF